MLVPLLLAVTIGVAADRPIVTDAMPIALTLLGRLIVMGGSAPRVLAPA